MTALVRMVRDDAQRHTQQMEEDVLTLESLTRSEADRRALHGIPQVFEPWQ